MAQVKTMFHPLHGLINVPADKWAEYFAAGYTEFKTDMTVTVVTKEPEPEPERTPESEPKPVAEKPKTGSKKKR